jgi:hypothetical protein
MRARILAFATLLAIAALLDAQSPGQKSPREALQPFGDLVGPWKGTGEPKGSREDIQKGFWTEKMEWGWKFKDKDAWMIVEFKKSKHFLNGELRYLADKDQYAMTLTNLKNEKLTFTGTLEIRDTTKILTLDRDEGKESQRLVFTLLHSNRFLYRFETKSEERPLYSMKWKVGVTRDGESFAAGSGKPECIVSGGLGTMAVSFQGKTYYVCCSGCRDEFNQNAAKYVKEYEAKSKKK